MALALLILRGDSSAVREDPSDRRRPGSREYRVAMLDVMTRSMLTAALDRLRCRTGVKGDRRS